MKRLRRAALVAICILFGVSLAADLAPASWYSRQYRDSVDAPPSLRFPLGADGLGRDRFMRLLHATGISLALAASSALAATLVAALVGGIAGYCGGWGGGLLARG